MSEIKYHIDSTLKNDNKITIIGWGFSTTQDKELHLTVEKALNIEIKRLYRVDVQNAFQNFKQARHSGFEINFEFESGVEIYQLVLKDDLAKEVVDISLKEIDEKERQEERNRRRRILKFINIQTFKKVAHHIKLYGIKSCIAKIKVKLEGKIQESIEYEEWFNEHKPTVEELKIQRTHIFEYMPLISIVVPIYNTPKSFFEEMVQSVINQTYSNWELCLADGGSKEEMLQILEIYKNKDSRIKIKCLSENLGISGNTNAGLEMATGEYIALLDHDDLLTDDALFEVVKVINNENKPDFIYTDEDKIDEHSKKVFDPHFKPDFSPDTLRSYNYITHFSVFTREVLKKAGNFNKDCDGSQDYDIILRITEKANKVIHISKILYHWRTHMNSVALNPQSKRYAYEAAKVALTNHLARVGLKGMPIDGKFLGSYKIEYDIEEKPLISIIIPNKDNKEDLEKCIKSVLDKSTYTNIEIIVVENNSSTTEIKEYYDELAAYKNIKVVKWEKEFNYSAINNYGVKFAKGEYMILLNNDTEVISPNWIEQMLMYCQREDMGVVGAKLYYPDDTIQHAGVVVGLAGSAGHIHHHCLKEEFGYFGRACIVQNLSAVTAACLMIKRKVFDKLEGFDENYAVALNDVDLCLRVREAGYLVVFNPYAELYHYESKSRGQEDTIEKIKRFENEVERFTNKWKDIIENGDKYYNINLTMNYSDFRLAQNKLKNLEES